MADNKKPADTLDPKTWKVTPFSNRSKLITRRGQHLVDDDIMPYMTVAPGETMHQRDEPEAPEYKRGGKVSNPFAKGGGANYGKDYSKRSK